MESAHMFSIANYREVMPEMEARAVFRKFRPEMFEAGFTQFFQDTEAFQAAIDAGQSTTGFIFGGLRNFYETVPDMFLLTMAFWEMNGTTMLERHPELHRELIGSSEETLEDMKRRGLGNSITAGGILPKLRDAITTAFTPKEMRWRYITKAFSQDRRIDLHFAKNVPDLSGHSTTEARLDAVIRLLSYDINDALAEVLAQKAITEEEFTALRETDRDQFGGIHKLVGLLYARNNLNGIINDIAGHGENNLFRNRPDLGNMPQTTDTGLCTGESYARNYIIGLGLSLRKNRETILEVLRENI